ncbi:MAG: PEP-CTERM sorting domain-containing protein [Planctomycetota bacterium]
MSVNLKQKYSPPKFLSGVACLLLFVTALSIAPVTVAQVNITVDTAEELSGSFSITGNASDFVIPSVFDDLPRDTGGPFAPFITIERNTSDEDVLINPSDVIVAASGQDPSFGAFYADGPSFADVTGSYVATSGGPTVFFSYTNLADTGGAGGTFSGDFSFVIPEPTSALLLAAGGLILGGVSRKRSRVI